MLPKSFQVIQVTKSSSVLDKIWDFESICEKYGNNGARIGSETAKHLYRLENAIAQINQKLTATSNAPIITPGARFDTIQSQIIREPYDWEITIVGSATLTTYIQRDSVGVHIPLSEC